MDRSVPSLARYVVSDITKPKMLTFRCSQKARNLLGLRDHDLSDETDGDLAEWFVDVATIERHRCLLFTHKVTLYSVWAIAVRKPDLLRFEELFRHHAIATLTADGFQPSEIERLLSAHGHRFAKTNSRPVTGSMNDHVQSSRWYIEQFAYVLDKMKHIDEGQGSLLDNMILLYGSEMKDGNGHIREDLPIILAGRGGGKLDTGRRVVVEPHTPLSNLHLTLAQKFGCTIDAFNNASSGTLSPLI